MVLLIPLGGLGVRFKNEGYKKPKPLIRANGKSIIFWLLDNLNIKNELIYIPYNIELQKYNFENLLKQRYPKFNFKFLVIKKSHDVKETLLLSLSKLNIDDEPILCLDGDNFYHQIDIIKLWDNKNRVFSFYDDSDKEIYSYIKTKNNKIIDIKEKQKISNYASTGAYGFSSWKLLFHYLKLNYTQNEVYISMIIKLMICNNIIFDYKLISKDNYFCLGTPFHLKYFDLTSYDKTNYYVNYKIQNNELVKQIQNNGSKIILVLKEQTIINENIYDEIIITDKDYFFEDDLEKETGYYNKFLKERSFNKIEINGDIVRKDSYDLSGEIYYYKNIPTEYKNYFPDLLNYDINNKWYEIKKVNGINVSDLYTNELLTEDNFKRILNILNTFHKKISSEKLDLNDNYLRKLEYRFQNYNYSIFSDYKIVYDNLKSKFSNYTNDCVLIHGDPVFTNIILENDNYKFIDMRGSVGDKLTIYGDKLYDLSKVYQSLIGYDEILKNKKVSDEYRNKMINIFNEFVETNYDKTSLDKIKDIVNLLIFTLIPLNDDDKKFKFYNLINIE